MGRHDPRISRLSAAAWRARVARSLLVWAILAALASLDRSRTIAAHAAGVFGAIMQVIANIVGVVGSIGEAIGQSLEGVVKFLGEAVKGLGLGLNQLAFGVKDLGSWTWAGIKLMWEDVIHPALEWVDRQVTKLHDWLNDTLDPVFCWIEDVTAHLDKWWDKYVRPVMDAIDWFKQLAGVLDFFHIHVLDSASAFLQRLEDKVEGYRLEIRADFVKVWNALDLAIDFGGLFQRLTLLKSLRRDMPYWFRLWWSGQTDPTRTNGSPYDRDREYPQRAPFEDAHELAHFYHHEGSQFDEQVPALVKIWREGVELDPPSRDYG